jgi:hypothetical protein
MFATHLTGCVDSTGAVWRKNSQRPYRQFTIISAPRQPVSPPEPPSWPPTRPFGTALNEAIGPARVTCGMLGACPMWSIDRDRHALYLRCCLLIPLATNLCTPVVAAAILHRRQCCALVCISGRGYDWKCSLPAVSKVIGPELAELAHI